MLIRDLFASDVTRDIPPVVFFHEKSPEKLADEVREYIITGGYPERDPRAIPGKVGIHEQFVRLLTQITEELGKKGGSDLPACWISGFYGSGKSSFAKLLGLALDGVTLPDGTPLSTALLRRDESPNASHLRAAWDGLTARARRSVGVVFDIGNVARQNEHIHAAALRQIQARLGYCPKDTVAAFELRLQKAKRWDAFLRTAEEVLHRPWSEVKFEELADHQFSLVLHRMDREQYVEPLSWLDLSDGKKSTVGTSVEEVVLDIDAMLTFHDPKKETRLFLVVDEVSQYVYADEDRMQRLHTFVSALGERLAGRVWLLATGQQKLEQDEGAGSIAKLKDRFPPRLRVHLDQANIRDVVHKRLLKKKPEHEAALRQQFEAHRPALKLYAYGCEMIKADDFIEVYPMLPGQIDLLLKITTNLRVRSRRTQGDDQAIRGLLQLLGELFRGQKLADREVGDLVTIDAIYDVQQSALDPDIQTTLARLFRHPEVLGDEAAQRAAKAVALLELIQDDGDKSAATTADLVAKCLYRRLGDGSLLDATTAALDKLKSLGFLAYSEAYGYKVQSSAGQEWLRQRAEFYFNNDQIAEACREKLASPLIGAPERPRLGNQSFPFAAVFSAGRTHDDARVQSAPSHEASFTVDFRFMTSQEARQPDIWRKRSDEEALKDRVLWVSGETGETNEVLRELLRSRAMVKQHSTQRASLPREKQRLLLEEEASAEQWESKATEAVARAFMDGTFYFRANPYSPNDFGTTFARALTAIGNRLVRELFHGHVDIAVTPAELNQLIEPRDPKRLSGVSPVFLEDKLGILKADAGKYVPACEGRAPRNVLDLILKEKSVSGNAVLAHFVRAPYGYPSDIVRACVAGLLLGEKVMLRTADGARKVSTISDAGSKDLLSTDRGFRGATIEPAGEQDVSPRDRIAIRDFLLKSLGEDVESDLGALTAVVFRRFSQLRTDLRGVEAKFERLPDRPELPPVLRALAGALEDCCRSPQAKDTVKAVRVHLDVLRDGVAQLRKLQTDLSDSAVDGVRAAEEACKYHLHQLRALGAGGEIEREGEILEQTLEGPQPWLHIAALGEAVGKIRGHYYEVRRGVVAQLGADLEAAQARTKMLEGFARLSADDAHAVLRPFAALLVGVDTDAVMPELKTLSETFLARLQAAEKQARHLLDERLIEHDDRSRPIIEVSARLSQRVIATSEDLEALLQELRERVLAQLKSGARVRIS
jgi:hypothetical protein